MSPFTLTLEKEAGGTIYEAARVATRIASMLDVYVDFDFNDLKMTARPGEEPMSLANRYFEWFEERRKAKATT